MGAILGCERCGSVVRRVRADGQEQCANCGHPMHVVGLIEARELVRARNLADRARLEPRLISSRKGGEHRERPGE